MVISYSEYDTCSQDSGSWATGGRIAHRCCTANPELTRSKCLQLPLEMAVSTATRDKLVLALFNKAVRQPPVSARVRGSGSGRHGHGLKARGLLGAAATAGSNASATIPTPGINGWFTDTAIDPCGDAFPGVSCTKDDSTGTWRVTM